LEFRGPASNVIEPRPGEATLNIFKMVQRDLAVSLRIALQQARASSKPVRKEAIDIQINGDKRKLNIEVSRLKPVPTGPVYYLVLFEEPALRAPEEEVPAKKRQPSGPSTDRRVNKLEKELKSTQEHLSAIVEQQETTNEELQSA